MIPAHFEYAAPGSLEEAVRLLQTNEGALILAGGHSLLPDVKLRRVRPAMLVDLRKIGGLRGISRRDGHLQIGAMTTFAQITADQDVQANYPVLAEAAESIGDPQVRNRGTIGGNLADADPASDLPAVALTLEATITTVGPQGTRMIPANQFSAGAFKTVLDPGEIVTSVGFPPSMAGTGSAYEKFKNPANLYAICGVAAKVVQAPNGTVRECRVAVIGATAVATRLHKVEAALEGMPPTAENVAAATELAAQGLTCLSDLFASAEYRADLAGVLAERALLRAIERKGVR